MRPRGNRVSGRSGAGLHFGRRSRSERLRQNPRRRRKRKRRDPTEGFPGSLSPIVPLCDECLADPQTGEAPGVTRSRNVRSRYRCSMCPAIHINSRSWLRSSSTHEPSDPPPRVVIFTSFGCGRVRATDSRRTLPVRWGRSTRRRTSLLSKPYEKKKISPTEKTREGRPRGGVPEENGGALSVGRTLFEPRPDHSGRCGPLARRRYSRRHRYPRLAFLRNTGAKPSPEAFFRAGRGDRQVL